MKFRCPICKTMITPSEEFTTLDGDNSDFSLHTDELWIRILMKCPKCKQDITIGVTGEIVEYFLAWTDKAGDLCDTGYIDVNKEAPQ